MQNAIIWPFILIYALNLLYILNVRAGRRENYHGGLEDRKPKFKWVFAIDEKVGDWLDQEPTHQ